jgi:hypothetical protein
LIDVPLRIAEHTKIKDIIALTGEKRLNEGVEVSGESIIGIKLKTMYSWNSKSVQ